MSHDSRDIAHWKFHKRNRELLKEFKQWLISKKTRPSEISKHTRNCDYFLNPFLAISIGLPAKEGIGHVSMFLGYWIIIKALWASSSIITQFTQSLVQFYTFLLEKGEITQQDLDLLIFTIKREKPKWLSSLRWYAKKEFNE